MEIIKYPNSILLTPCKELEDFDVVLENYDKLIQTTNDLKALGVAANQVGLSGRFFTARLNIEDSSKIDIIINPYILKQSEDLEIVREGCLSFPGLSIEVSRSLQILVSYTSFNPTNKKFFQTETKLSSLPARIFNHEVEHLNGKNFLSTLSSLRRDMYLKKYLKTSKMKKGPVPDPNR